MKLSDFDYSLSSAQIAQTPSLKRDESRLLIVDRSTGQIHESIFKNILNYLSKTDLLVLNDTKVFKARLYGQKKTGGQIEILLLQHIRDNEWLCLLKGHCREDMEIIFIPEKLKGIIIKKANKGRVHIRFNSKEDVNILLEKYGQIPLPPYIKRASPLPEDKNRYQTIYCQNKGAVAAPTAGLHFTHTLFDEIKKMGVDIVFLTLHVGPGTFQPVRVKNIEEHIMDREYYILPNSSRLRIQKAKKEGNRIIAVGTTSTRVLESCASEILGNNISSHDIEGWTDLFIYPGYQFKIVDSLITNFHLPQSTLLMLCCAFGGYNLMMNSYRSALDKKFRFYSYGDAMFII